MRNTRNGIFSQNVLGSFSDNFSLLYFSTEYTERPAKGIIKVIGQVLSNKNRQLKGKKKSK